MSQGHFNIAVCGSAATNAAAEIGAKAFHIGELIAQSGNTLFTGATFGFSYEAAKGAHAAGGNVVGIAPGESLADQYARCEHIDPEYWTTIIYTGVGYKMRDVVMIRSVDAVIYIGGGVGTLVEMATAVDYQKVMGVLVGSGGATTLYKDIARISHRFQPDYVLGKDPDKLVAKVISRLRERKV